MRTPQAPAARRATTSARSTGPAWMPPARRREPSPARGRRWGSENGRRRGMESWPSPRRRRGRRRGKDPLGTMAVDRRKIAIATAGFCTFLTLYSPQALLPSLAREFGVGAAEISAIMTASTLAIALTAPFTGAVADVLGRKRVIAAAMLAIVVPMAGAAFAPDVQALIGWRFLQGLLLPPIFAVTVAYIGDEWPPVQVAGVAGIYIAGSSLGGFCGRLVPGVLGDLIGWRGAFLTLAGLSLIGAVTLTLLLPKGFVRSQGLAASARQMPRHLKNPQLLATYGIGFGVLF